MAKHDLALGQTAAEAPPPRDLMLAALTAANDALYAAEKLARKTGHSYRAELLAMCWKTDRMKDDL